VIVQVKFIIGKEVGMYINNIIFSFQIFNHQMKMDGFGQDQELRLDQQHKEILVTGATQEDIINHNQTTERLHKEMTNLAFQFLITFIMMD